MKAISILHVISSADRKGGGPIEGVLQLNGSLTKLGHDSEIVSLDAPDAPWLAGMPLHVHALGPGVSGYGYAPRLIPWLQRNAGRYDHVIVNGIWQYHSFATRKALRPLGIPYASTPTACWTPGSRRPTRSNTPKSPSTGPGANTPSCATPRPSASPVRRSASWPASPSPATSAARPSSATAPPPPPATPTPSARLLRRHPQLRGKRLLLFLSRLHVKKGCDLLLDAFARVAASDLALHLLMAGPDQTGWQATLQAQSERLGIADRVTWPGMLTGDLKWGAFHAADAFVLPSHQENFGIAVAEALACGLPVLISDKVNIWREIDADRAGLVGADTTDGTADLLRRWLALPDADRQAMQKNTVQCFNDRFEITNAAHSLLRVLQPQPESEPCLQS